MSKLDHRHGRLSRNKRKNGVGVGACTTSEDGGSSNPSKKDHYVENKSVVVMPLQKTETRKFTGSIHEPNSSEDDTPTNRVFKSSGDCEGTFSIAMSR
ncbi:hypothetical protein KIN20_000128 [Parelaphostrongylus tenuis]|uniref:Uncharacterized protein n=1 Tax=Parelaphostrongylus tenuis TaxID=148309 RepID=A0AAD5QDK1_PARTN|nr:hypothetical protein KIN20_000128 [Parelaphostrongylus tenuis]